MNQSSSVSSSSSTTSPDAVSRRAYELWEQEGRPEGSDLRHWLQAEKELSSHGADQSGMGNAAPSSATNGNGDRHDNGLVPASAPVSRNSDVAPLQGTRAASAAGRESKRGSSAPFDKSASTAGRKKPSNSPIM